MAAATAHRVGFKVGKNLREIHLCQCSASSQEVRDFIEKHNMELKKVNSDFPILICECSQVQPKLWVLYAFGKVKNVSLNNLSSEQVATALVNVMKSQENIKKSCLRAFALLD